MDLVRPTVAVINLDNLKHNFQTIKKHISDTKLLCVIKADAYGHGIVEYAQVLSKLGVDYFGVAIVEEGIELRKAGIWEPILVLGDVIVDQIDLFFQYNLQFTIASDIQLLRIDKRAGELGMTAKAHLNIDTGMGRIGVNHSRVYKYIEAVKKSKNTIIEGVYSHFARSTDSAEYTNLQFERFQKAVDEIIKAGLNPGLRHIANSAAALSYPEMKLDMVRVGIMLHGAFPSEDKTHRLPLKPVMTLKTKVVYFKTMDPGEYVSYGSTWEPKEKGIRVITLPVGYADGYGRRMEANTHVLIHGKKYPVIGRVCMDQCMVSLGLDGEAYPGDEVILMGKQGDLEITAEELSKQMGTVEYELFIKITKRVPRIYIHNQY